MHEKIQCQFFVQLFNDVIVTIRKAPQLKKKNIYPGKEENAAQFPRSLYSYWSRLLDLQYE